MGKQDLFRNLPSEITTNILSRLPIRSISISKCVCKAWFDLLDSDYFDFVKSKIKTPLTIVRTEAVWDPETVLSVQCDIWEFEDEEEADALRFHPLTHIRIPYSARSSWVQQTNESFSFFSAPNAHGHAGDEGPRHMRLSVLGGCLCLSYTLGESKYFDIWSMKEYQVEESWTKHQIRIDTDYEFEIEHMLVTPIKVYKNSDVLMFLDDSCLVYYSNKMRTTQQVGMFDLYNTTIFTPNLFSLKNFGGENVISLQTSMQPQAKVEQIADEIEQPAPA
ncbi:uncharacterized protein LOC121771852 [Salvia splendens]|uniref:uncharacterized protein LOC121771852 n=1 Tax=Salvia splendens TaxID=180675 RepID=UPI001C27A9AF|nr:uncharacterized protein LOC121771852 [Salvia splendens]